MTAGDITVTFHANLDNEVLKIVHGKAQLP
jgi:hypothetical protein